MRRKRREKRIILSNVRVVRLFIITAVPDFAFFIR